ncbi:MAG: hypothetical protein K2G90_01475 [Muribaculaceae bacterium]|nr:hypothetical protein [Muribaculaceae bacterium]
MSLFVPKEYALEIVRNYVDAVIEKAAAHLLKLSHKVDTEKMGQPSFLMVLTAGEYAYRRKDGVWVVPLGCLKD